MGANMTPRREIVEQAPKQLFLIEVGNTSLEYNRKMA